MIQSPLFRRALTEKGLKLWEYLRFAILAHRSLFRRALTEKGLKPSSSVAFAHEPSSLFRRALTEKGLKLPRCVSQQRGDTSTLPTRPNGEGIETSESGRGPIQ